MKLKFIFFVILLTTIALSTKAQKTDTITDSELNRYAVMIDSLDALKKQRTEISKKLAKGDSKITAIRYNQLIPIIDDKKKLTEAKATADEIAYVKKALEILTEESKKFQNAFNSLFAEYVGYDTYNKVKSAIETNPKVKYRYEVEYNRINGIFYSKE
jgi:hypothetical protein